MERIDPARNIRHLHYGILMLRFINIFWSVFNLIPIFPLDGGQVSREVCTMISPRLGSWFSLGLSFLLAGLVVIYSAIVMSRPSGELWYPSYGSYQMVPIFAILMFGFMGLQCLFMMRASRMPSSRRRTMRRRSRAAIMPEFLCLHCTHTPFSPAAAHGDERKDRAN